MKAGFLPVLFALAVSACAPGGPAPAVPPTPTSTTVGTATVQVARHPTLGQVLSDGAGRTLYVFTGDGRNSSTCDASCAQTWPPLKSGGSPRASEGVKADLLSTFTRPDGSLQVAYAGMPLYYFAGDAAPGDAKGQNVGGAWFVLSPMGEAVKPAAASTPAAPAPGPATPAADYGY